MILLFLFLRKVKYSLAKKVNEGLHKTRGIADERSPEGQLTGVLLLLHAVEDDYCRDYTLNKAASSSILLLFNFQ